MNYRTGDCPDGKYTVKHLQDNIWQIVYEYYVSQIGSSFCETLEDVLFQGSIADCEAYLRLKEKGQV